MLKRLILVVFPFVIITISCTPYNIKQAQLHQAILKGDYQQANVILEKGYKSEHNSDNKLLYFMNRGLVSYLNHDYETSNEYFNIADNIHEDQRANFGDVLLKYTISSMMTTYLGEKHEIFFVHYYKTLNYLALGEIDEALVECRRMNTDLELLSDKYKNNSQVYCRDAFAHTLMGIVYQAAKDYNNAFIAYRNAIEIFENKNYQKTFKIPIPQQLQKDIIYVAYKLADYGTVKLYKNKFHLESYNPSKGYKDCGDLVCFWNNGLCSKKETIDIIFIVEQTKKMITFINSELGLCFTAPAPAEDISSLKILKVSLPKYEHCISAIDGGFLKVNGKQFKLEKLEDINKVAKKVLTDRMSEELGEMLLRLAIKEVSKTMLKKEYIIVFDLFSCIIEQADTRNWQTLPYEILYTRVTLPENDYSVKLCPSFNKDVKYRIRSRYSKKNCQDTISIKRGGTNFLQFNTLFGSI